MLKLPCWLGLGSQRSPSWVMPRVKASVGSQASSLTCGVAFFGRRFFTRRSEGAGDAADEPFAGDLMWGVTEALRAPESGRRGALEVDGEGCASEIFSTPVGDKVDSGTFKCCLERGRIFPRLPGVVALGSLFSTPKPSSRFRRGGARDLIFNFP